MACNHKCYHNGDLISFLRGITYGLRSDRILTDHGTAQQAAGKRAFYVVIAFCRDELRLQVKEAISTDIFNSQPETMLYRIAADKFLWQTPLEQ